ncbi:hypothetical protein JB92DRAFT_2827220 [Gautieria morchelliformis]|nr:hypothetical protein JB92DRAFT_2827220 [Gautieria morchelliformis]
MDVDDTDDIDHQPMVVDGSLSDHRQVQSLQPECIPPISRPIQSFKNRIVKDSWHASIPSTSGSIQLPENRITEGTQPQHQLPDSPRISPHNGCSEVNSNISTSWISRRLLPQLPPDYLPEGPRPLEDNSLSSSVIEAPAESMESTPHTQNDSPNGFGITRVRLCVRQTICTIANTFGLYQEYQGIPKNTPDENPDITDLNRELHKARFWSIQESKYPQSAELVLELEVFHAPEGFNPLDVQVADLHTLDKLLQSPRQLQVADKNDVDSHSGLFAFTDGWIESAVDILVPDSVPHSLGNTEAPKFSVPHFYYHQLTEVIKAAFTSPATKGFHFSGYKQFWQPPNEQAAPQRVFDEVYTSDSFLAVEE